MSKKDGSSRKLETFRKARNKCNMQIIIDKTSFYASSFEKIFTETTDSKNWEVEFSKESTW